MCVTVTSGACASSSGSRRLGRRGARQPPLALASSSDPTARGPQRGRTSAGHLAALPILTELGARFADAGHELALVGGPVRDALLGRTPPDLDFTTDAPPDADRARCCAAWGDAHWDIGREFGTIGARKGGTVVVEVTTYRTETYDPTSRKPEVAFGDTLEGDLVRRDFTVNAMACGCRR